jgi:hypothetical protein
MVILCTIVQNRFMISGQMLSRSLTHPRLVDYDDRAAAFELLSNL